MCSLNLLTASRHGSKTHNASSKEKHHGNFRGALKKFIGAHHGNFSGALKKISGALKKFIGAHHGNSSGIKSMIHALKEALKPKSRANEFIGQDEEESYESLSYVEPRAAFKDSEKENSHKGAGKTHKAAGKARKAHKASKAAHKSKKSHHTTAMTTAP